MLRELKDFLNGIKITKNKILVSFIHFFGFCFAYLYYFLIAKYFGTNGTGLFSLTITVITILGVIGIFGLDKSILRLVSKFSAEQSYLKIKIVYYKSVSFSMILTIIIGFLLFVFSEFIAISLFEDILMISFLKIGALMLPIIIFYKITIQALRGTNNIFHFILFQSPIIYLVSVISLFVGQWVFNFNNPILIIYSYLIGVAINSILVYYFWRVNNISTDKSKSERNLSTKYIIKYTLPLFVTEILVILIGWIDKFLLGIFVTTQEVGIYTISQQISSLVIIILFIVNSYAAPKFSYLYTKRNFKNLESYAKLTTKIIFFVTLPLSILLWFLTPFILNLFGENFIMGINIVRILLLGQFINAISGSVGYFMQMTGMENEYLLILLEATILNVIVNIVLILLMGFIGAAISTSLSIIYLNIKSNLIVKKQLGFNLFIF